MIYQFADFEIDTQNYRLCRAGDCIDVEPKVFDLLVYLVGHCERVITRDELLENLWPGMIVSDTSLSNRVKAARQAIGDSGQEQSFIKTIHGRGYQFIATVNDVVPSDPANAADQKSRPAQAISVEDSSIAVLPFANLSGDSDKDYFCDGITDDILTGLCRFRELLVIARGSVYQFKGTEIDPTEAALKLSVKYVLQGSLRVAGEQVRINARLIEGASGRPVWAENYDRILDDVFAVQDDVTQNIVSALARRLERSGLESAMKKSSGELTVNDLLYRARHILPDWFGSREEILQAREYYEKAAELQPDSAAAYSGLAITYCAEYPSDWTEDRAIAAQRCFEFARKAIALDDSDSNAHLALATAYRDIDEDFELSLKHMNLAISANPNDYWSYCAKCNLMTVTGEYDEGVSCGEEAIRRSPLLPDSCLRNIGLAEYLSGRYQHALGHFRESPNPEPQVEAYVAACYAQLGRTEEAFSAAQHFLELNQAQEVIDDPGDSKRWRDYWASVAHMADTDMQDQLLEGLRKAGVVN